VGWCVQANFLHASFCLGNAQFAPGLWFLNIFVPMFGQYDWQGRSGEFFCTPSKCHYSIRVIAHLGYGISCIARIVDHDSSLYYLHTHLLFLSICYAFFQS
jgi:hypothetical protein